ncbi:MAG: hypothetical protein ACREIA_13295 [Opitutaceae bacterium]
MLRISFAKTLELLRPLWLVLALGEDLLSEQQKRELTERFYTQARRWITAPKRKRSCPRAIRQPVSKWPRKIKNGSSKGPVQFRVV